MWNVYFFFNNEGSHVVGHLFMGDYDLGRKCKITLLYLGTIIDKCFLY